jgi:hypothetical protein
MTILEEKIRKNRELYDAHEPIEGHAARFAEKLDENFHQGDAKKSVLFILVRYAAGVLIIAAVATVLLFQYSDSASVASAENNNDELTKMMAYYDMLADQKLNKINGCTESGEEATKVNQMASEQIQVLESDAVELKEKLDDDSSDERVYSALVNNYRTRIKILDNIISNICEL